MISRVPPLALLPYLLLFIFFQGSVLSAVVTLKSAELYTTHEWIPTKPVIYFQCSGEKNKTYLPDVQEADVLYNFKGEESWQPLTELLTKKCKRCGIYEESMVSDHIFDEWELCSSDFAAPDGIYTRFKEDEFNVTFVCKECLSLVKDSPPTSEDSDKGRVGGKKHYAVPILVTITVIAAVVIVFMAAYKFWQKKKRQSEQARFLKLFEDDDDMEDEFGVSEMVRYDV